MGCGEDNLFSKRCLSRRIIFATTRFLFQIYKKNGASEGSRTLVTGLGSRGITVLLHSLKLLLNITDFSKNANFF